MAYGPMSVGSDGTFNLLTDKTLSIEELPADAKAVGDKFKMVYTKTEADNRLAKKADSFIAQTSDPGAGSALETDKLLVVYV